MVRAFLSEGESPGLQHRYEKSQPREEKGISPLLALSFNEIEIGRLKIASMKELTFFLKKEI